MLGVYAYYFTFRSVTAAMQGSRTLAAAGLESLMVRTPAALKKQGCGYSLRVRQEALRPALAALRSGGPTFGRIYRRAEDGSWKEVTV